MSRPLLNDSSVVPSPDVLSGVLGGSYDAYIRFVGIMASTGAVAEWSYYNDGKSWLCKVCRGKKTLCWLSAWDGFFRVVFYFTAKTMPGVLALDIDPAIREGACECKPVGKLLPMVVDVHDESIVADLAMISEYKISCK